VAASLGWYWFTRATTEGVWWMDQLLAPGKGSAHSLTWAYFTRGFLSVLQADPNAARPWLDCAIATARDSHLPVQLAHSLSMASIAAGMAGDRNSGQRLLAEARVVTERLDDVPAALSLLQARCLSGLFEGDLELVLAAAAEGVRLARQTDDSY